MLVLAQDKTKGYPPIIKKPVKESGIQEIFSFEIRANDFTILSLLKESQDASLENCIVTTGKISV